MNNINAILDVLYAVKLGLPVIYKDDYGTWRKVDNKHIFNFHHEYIIVFDEDAEKYLENLNKGRI
jgi:hypothetical protein|nr:MAG TPA: hypothetical protein [Caudoviricetes sp.]